MTYSKTLAGILCYVYWNPKPLKGVIKKWILELIAKQDPNIMGENEWNGEWEVLGKS